jgi:hypothetical protein
VQFFTTEQDERLNKTEMLLRPNANAQFFSFSHSTSGRCASEKRFRHQHTCYKWQETDGLSRERAHVEQHFQPQYARLSSPTQSFKSFVFSSSQRAAWLRESQWLMVCANMCLCVEESFSLFRASTRFLPHAGLVVILQLSLKAFKSFRWAFNDHLRAFELDFIVMIDDHSTDTWKYIFYWLMMFIQTRQWLYLTVCDLFSDDELATIFCMWSCTEARIK